MKTSLIKKTARTFFLVQAVMLVTSCSNFLNIDNYFDDEFNIDSVFTNARYMEAYMWGAAAMFPDEAQTIRNGYTLGPMATDEGFNGLTGSGTANIYHGMDFANGKITQDFLGDGSPNLNQWGKYYKIIRKCNSILQNLDRPKDLTNSERLRLEGYTRFIRAFAYYNLLVDYGPAILLGDEVVNTNEPIEYYDRPRATYDETMNYTCEEFEKAARLLPSPQDVSTLDFGRPTKGAALGLVARLRLIHASPLFNGGPVASSYFGNWKRKTDGVHYVSQQYDESRWAVAAAAAKRVMDMGAYKLYTYAKDDNTPELPAGVTSDPNFYDAYPNGADGIDPFKSYSDIYILMLHHTLLHDFGSTQERLPHNQINLLSQSGQVNSLFTSRITAADHCYHLLAIEETITSSASTDAHTGIFLFIIQSQIFGCSARSNYQRISFNHLLFVNRYFVWSRTQVRSGCNTKTQVCTETLCLFAQIIHQLLATDTFRITGKVLHICSCCQLTTRL